MDKCFTAVVLSVLILNFSVTGYAQAVDREILLEHYQAPMFIQLSDQTYLLGETDVESGVPQLEKPPLSNGRIAGEIVVGGMGGFAAVLACWEVFEDPDRDDDFGGFVGLILGEVIGSTLSVYLVGNIGNETGSFLATLGGSVLGAGVGVATSLVIGEPGALLLVWCPSIGATAVFNVTRRYDSPAESETALINVRDSQMSLAVPRVYFRGDRFGRGGLSQNIDLLRVRF